MTNWKAGIFSDGSAMFVMPETPSAGDEVIIRLRTFANCGIDQILFSTLINGEERVDKMLPDGSDGFFDYYAIRFMLVHKVTRYHFIIIRGEDVYFYNMRGIEEHAVLKRHEFTIIADTDFPCWTRDDVFYQIFPDRFYNGDESNDVQVGEYILNGYTTCKQDWDEPLMRYMQGGNANFYGGDLDGIIDKLDYIKDLGVTAIYLNPIFTALSNHKYDCIDFFHVDEHLGGDEALVRLSDALHNNGMKLVLDISINHVGKHHPWCRERPEFFFLDENGELECWNGCIDLPVLNYNSHELRDIIYRRPDSVLKKWLSPPYNADGWRFDVGQSTGLMKQSKLDFDLWCDIRAELKAIRPDAYLFAEHWDDCIDYLQGDMWDASMNYYGFTRSVRKFLGDRDYFLSYKTDCKRLKVGGDIFDREVNELHSFIPHAIREQLLNLVGSHDYPRVSCALGRTEAMLAAMFQLIMPGVPCIYYGDEIHLGGYLEEDAGARFPMEWTQSKWDTGYLDLYRFLINLRKSSNVLKSGSFRILLADAHMIVIARFNGNECLLFVCANAPANATCSLESIGVFSTCEHLKSVGELSVDFSKNTLNISAAGTGGVICRLP